MKIDITSRDFTLVFLIIVGLVFILEMNTTLKSNIVFGDEGFHAGISRWISQNKEYPQWNPLGYTNLSQTNFARPPLFHLLEAGFLFVLGRHELIFKFLSPFTAALTVIAFYLLVKRLYNKELGLISSLIFIGLPSFVTYAVLVFDEILFVFNMLLFTFTFLLAIKENSRKYWVLSAVFAGLTILTKNVGIVLILFIPLSFLYIFIKEKNFKYNVKRFAAFAIIILLVTGPFFLRNIAHYNTPVCYGLPILNQDTTGCEKFEVVEKRSFEVRTLSGGTENSIMRFGLLNFVTFAYGNYWFILVGLIGGLIILLNKQNEKINSLLLIAMVLVLYVLYLTYGRAEDASRQILFWASIMVVISAHYWGEIYKLLQNYNKYLGLIVIGMILFFGYQNITEKLPVMQSVKTFSPSFFEACDWVKGNLPEDVRIMTFWGHRAAYACERTISPGWADIRLNDDAEDVVNVAEMHGITHFFIQKFSITQQPSRESYSLGFVALLENNSDKFEKVYENGPPLDQCLQQGSCDGNIIYKVVY